MEQIFIIFEKFIDIKLALLILISSYWVKKQFSDFLPRVKDAHKILLWSIIVSLLYWLGIVKTGVVDAHPLYNFVLTYFFATSFYELAWRPLENWITNKLNKDSK